MSCFFRMKNAKELCESHGITAKEIAGLTGMRLISESERSATDTYALGADTEFDLMCAAAQNVFEVAQVESFTKTTDGNLNSSWAIAQYKGSISITMLRKRIEIL